MAVLLSLAGGCSGWPLWIAPHAWPTGVVGGGLLFGAALIILHLARCLRQITSRRLAVAFTLALSLLTVSLLFLAGGAGHKMRCGMHGLSNGSSLRAAVASMMKHVSEGKPIDSSIAVFLLDEFDGDWYSDPLPECACGSLAPPMVGSIDLRDVFQGRVTKEQLIAEFDRIGGTDADWEQIGDVFFLRAPRLSKAVDADVIAAALRWGCPPRMSMMVCFSYGRLELLHVDEPGDRTRVLDAATSAIMQGIPAPPREVLAPFGITEADVQSLVQRPSEQPEAVPRVNRP